MSTKAIQIIFWVIGIIAMFIGFVESFNSNNSTILIGVFVGFFILYAIIRPLCIIAKHYEKLDGCVPEDKLMNFLKSKLF